MEFREWLKKVKGLSDQEIEELSFTPKKYIRLSEQYIKWKER